MNLKYFTIDGSKKIKLKEFETEPDKKILAKKEELIQKTEENLLKMAELQDKLYAESKEGIIVVLQAMDAAGKDSTIRKVMTILNPEGVDVYPYKVPSKEELAHDFLWRCITKLPQRGKIAIFNRSYYEDVLVVKVHELYKTYNMAKRSIGEDIFDRRYKEIKGFEKYAYDNSYRIVKIFLHLSKDEQKKRFIERIDKKMKNWKFSNADVVERGYWNEYQKAYEDAINGTSTNEAPWYIIPADCKWYSRYLVSEAMLKTMKDIDPQYPVVSDDEKQQLISDKNKLLAEEK
jgi:PPK2 family polyphosphate:nucleotide phosphotransferase